MTRWPITRRSGNRDGSVMHLSRWAGNRSGCHFACRHRCVSAARAGTLSARRCPPRLRNRPSIIELLTRIGLNRQRGSFGHAAQVLRYPHRPTLPNVGLLSFGESALVIEAAIIENYLG